MSLDKQEILSELGSVMNKLQSAECGCMGNIFSQGNPKPEYHGNCRQGGHHTCGHAPCAGEPCPLNYGGCPRRCAGYNAPKIMSDTYGYLRENVMQPVIKEVYNDLKSLSPTNTVANNPLASQMGLMPNTPTNMGDNVGGNLVHQMGMAAPTPNTGHGNSPALSNANNNFMTNPQNSLNTGNFGMHHNHAKPLHHNAQFCEMFGDLSNSGLGFDPMAIAKQMNPANEKKAAMVSMNKALLGSGNTTNTAYNKLQRQISPGQLQPANTQQELMQPMRMQQGQLYPVGVQQGHLQPQTMPLPVKQEQLQPIQEVAIPKEQMQSMGQMEQGLLQPQGQMPQQVQTQGQMHHQALIQQQGHMPQQGQVPQQGKMTHSGQVPQQGQMHHQGQIVQGQMVQQGQMPQQVQTQGQMHHQGQIVQGQMVQQGQMPQQVQTQGQMHHQALIQQQGHMPQQGQVPQQGKMTHPGQVPQQGQMNHQGQIVQGQMPQQGQMHHQGQIQHGQPDGYNLAQGQPVETLMPVQTQPVQQGKLYQPKQMQQFGQNQQRNEEKYNTLGQPVQQLPAHLYDSYIPPGPQTLAAQPAFYPPNFNVKGVVSKTSISGGTAVGKLNYFYNMNNGSNAREHLPERPVNDVDKIMPSNSAALVNVQDPKVTSIVNPEGIQEQREAAGAAGDIPPILIKRTRNGLQDLNFVSKPISAAWSFHGEKRHTPLHVRPRA